MAKSIVFVTLLPLIGFLINGLFGKKIKNEKLIGFIGTAAVGGAFLIALSIYFGMLGRPAEDRASVVTVFNWMAAGNFSVNWAYQVDQLSILFTMIITGIGSLIHLYSIGYMHGDKSFYRFFAYLNLFVFMMLHLVLADNML
ncbi:MAG TPA: NADH-quinone oxidoreductase subunit L, partial [Patescibacteria group bacterium]|nr:NADH-quinone oxidoreductase subunit L [Patescibacteria group bacterium]